MTRTNPLALDAKLQVGRQAPGGPVTGYILRVPVGADHLPLALHAAVVEGRLADELDLHVAFQAEHGADEQVVPVSVGRRACVRRNRVLAAARSQRKGV